MGNPGKGASAVRTGTPFQDRPDFDHLRRVLLRETRQGPVPLVEFEVDPEHMIELSGYDFPLEKLSMVWNVLDKLTPEVAKLGLQLIDLSLAFSAATNYDYVTMLGLVPLTTPKLQLTANPKQNDKLRAWQEEHRGIITTRAEFDSYPWPTFPMINILPLQYAAAKLQPGSKFMVLIVGIFEGLRELMSFENMAIATVDQPELVQDILERLAVLTEHLVDKAAAFPATGAIFYADDMAFNTQTMISPKLLREWVIPRIKRIADTCHKHGKPFLFHGCGQIDCLMEDLIEVVGIDAKHSFQDNIEPVEETYEKYGDRISIIGGLDVDLMARGSEIEVRKRVREILEACAPGGSYCMGSGNSVTNFCKMENYLAMVDETRQWNQEHS